MGKIIKVTKHHFTKDCCKSNLISTIIFMFSHFVNGVIEIIQNIGKSTGVIFSAS